MIGQRITGPDGKPLVQYENLAKSAYQPSPEVMDLFAKCQMDYQVAYNLSHQAFDEFDGMSLLQRARLDQETFSAFVGAQYIPQHKKWRWRGRKNTARNKLIGMLAHMLAGMLYPAVHASNDQDEEDKKTARVMRIVVENHLRKAGYELKFLYMVLSALVNPAVIVMVEYVEGLQRIKEKLSSGKINIITAIDELVSGLMLNIKSVEDALPMDYYTLHSQLQPAWFLIDRIPYDRARKMWGNNPNFEFVIPGKTKVVLSGQENQTLYDIDWTEADPYYVQVLKCLYRDEDLEAVFVGGVFMGNETDIYNNNSFKHRRSALVGDRWVSIPVYPIAKSFAEPIDPTGRFFWGKSMSFKEYWDDATQNKTHQLLIDGTTLDVLKPMLISGLAKADSTVIAPAATIALPMGASVAQYSLGPNLAAALTAMQKQEQDMSESTQDSTTANGSTQQGITATQTIKAENNAKIFLGVLALLIGDLLKQVGELVVDCTIQHTLKLEVDAMVPGMLRLKQKVLLSKGKERGKDVTNRVVFTDQFMGKAYTDEQVNEYEWNLWKKAGGDQSDQYIYHANPYMMARMKYSLYVDADEIVNSSMGNNKLRKLTSFNILTDPRVLPFTDQKAVADDIIEEFSPGDPDRFKAKGNVNDLMSAVMGNQGAPRSNALVNVPKNQELASSML